MRKKFNCEIGYSDHSIGYNAAIGAVHQGASFIEKHVCLDKKIGIDSKFSLKVHDIPKLKSYINEAYLSRGKISYGPSKNELPSLQFRRSIYVSVDIKKGERFSKSNIKVIRPGLGLEPKYYKHILGKKSLVNIKFATPLKWKYIKN